MNDRLNKGYRLNERYEIIRDLGEGGFGVTYLATDLHRPSRPLCVVKQLRSLESQVPEIRDRILKLFEKEAVILEKLGKHSQIPELIAHFEENSQLYIVQEFIDGKDLSQEIYYGKKYDEDYVIKFLKDTLNVLSFVHKSNVIHRDIKPPNLIRRTIDSRIVLIDFGGVKELKSIKLNRQGHVIPSSVVFGTPGYASDEQVRGIPCQASDIYAIGMTAIQALTGIPPHQLPRDPQTNEIIWRNQTQVSQSLASVLDKMVRQDFKQRYTSAVEAVEDLNNKQNLRQARRSPVQNPKGRYIRNSSDAYQSSRIPHEVFTNVSISNTKEVPWLALIGVLLWYIFLGISSSFASSVITIGIGLITLAGITVAVDAGILAVPVVMALVVAIPSAVTPELAGFEINVLESSTGFETATIAALSAVSVVFWGTLFKSKSKLIALIAFFAIGASVATVAPSIVTNKIFTAFQWITIAATLITATKMLFRSGIRTGCERTILIASLSGAVALIALLTWAALGIKPVIIVASASLAMIITEELIKIGIYLSERRNINISFTERRFEKIWAGQYGAITGTLVGTVVSTTTSIGISTGTIEALFTGTSAIILASAIALILLFGYTILKSSPPTNANVNDGFGSLIFLLTVFLGTPLLFITLTLNFATARLSNFFNLDVSGNLVWTFLWNYILALFIAMLLFGGVHLIRFSLKILASEKLLASFRKWEVFLILILISGGGLGLGWLVRMAFQ